MSDGTLTYTLFMRSTVQLSLAQGLNYLAPFQLSLYHRQM